MDVSQNLVIIETININDKEKEKLMATFDEKEFLWEEMYISTKNLMLNKVSPDEPFPEEWLKDRKILEDFRWEIADKEPEEINFDEAMNFYKSIEDKYKFMPNK